MQMTKEEIAIASEFPPTPITWGKALLSKGCLNSLHILAHAYNEGDNCEQDVGKAFEYFKRAEKLGDPCVLYHLGAMYGEGRGVEKNVSMALKYYSRAEKAGHKDASKAIQTIVEEAEELD